MKKKFLTPQLVILLFSFFIFSCSDSLEPIDSIAGDNEEVVNDDNTSEDSDSEDDSNDGNSGDGSDDTTDDGNTGDDSSDDSSGNDDTSGDSTDDNSGGGDDTNNDGTNGDDTSDVSLAGNWRLVSATINNGQASTVFNGIPVNFPFSSTSQDEDVDIVFQENPNTIQGMGQYTNVIEFTILGNAFSEETVFESPLTDGNWEMNNNELIISGGSQANGTFTITEFTATSLILQTEFEETVPADDLELDATGVLVIELARN